ARRSALEHELGLESSSNRSGKLEAGSWRSLPHHLVRVDGVLIADEQLAAGDDRVAPRRQVAGRDPEAPVLAVSGGAWFGQSHHAVFAEKVQSIVGRDERTLANAAIAPRDLARVELHRRQDAARESIQIVANQHRARVVI